MPNTLFFINPQNTDDYIRVDVLFHPCIMFKYDDKIITINKSKDFVYNQASLNDELYQYGMISKMVKSFNSVNSYVQNRQQPRLEVLNEIAEILDVNIKSLIISNKPKK